jgi:hypothetical protein
MVSLVTVFVSLVISVLDALECLCNWLYADHDCSSSRPVRERSLIEMVNFKLSTIFELLDQVGEVVREDIVLLQVSSRLLYTTGGHEAISTCECRMDENVHCEVRERDSINGWVRAVVFIVEE